MPDFSEDTIRLAWERSGGKCECARSLHEHTNGKCHRPLSKDKRSKAGEPGAWEARRKGVIACIKVTGMDDWHKCEILCWDCFTKAHEKSFHGKIAKFVRWRPFGKKK